MDLIPQRNVGESLSDESLSSINSTTFLRKIQQIDFDRSGLPNRQGLPFCIRRAPTDSLVPHAVAAQQDFP